MGRNKSYRIKANIKEDKVLTFDINQDYDIFEVLSLKIGKEGLYKLHTSNYGCIVGRVLANDAFGIPNAKISVFIPSDEVDDSIISGLYPYTKTTTKNDDDIRYNLLPDEEVKTCHAVVGTFPNKRLMLDDDNVIEVFDKYYKYTTRTNNSGDYMIFGIPTGTQTVHCDIDLSDIGILSQKPRDMIFKGYNINQFESPSKFKTDTNIDNLVQIISEDNSINVYPFWGDESEGIVAITRCDIAVQYKFEPTCVFMGSLVTDQKTNFIGKKCIPGGNMGRMDQLAAGYGRIEMIRKTPNGTIEEFQIQGNELINGNGVWCYQIPMNLDYMATDEYGNMVATNDSTKGIPTRTSVRFRVSLTDSANQYESSHLCKVLIPNNPDSIENIDYHFGSQTKDSSFKDLLWNNVYSIKSYIPRIQKGNAQRNNRFSGIKAVNINNDKNSVPYNNMRINMTFKYILQCAIFNFLVRLVSVLNKIIGIIYTLASCGQDKKEMGYVTIGDGMCPDLENYYFAPGGSNETLLLQTLDNKLIDGEEDSKSIGDTNNDENASHCITSSITWFKQCVEMNLATEEEVIQFDFYNDWINGMVYMPRWGMNIRKRRSFLFGLIKVPEKIMACNQDTYNDTRLLVQQCGLEYTNENEETDHKACFRETTTDKGCASGNKQRCHRAGGRRYARVFKKYNNNLQQAGGLVHTEQTIKLDNVYYYKPCEWVDNTGDYIYGTYTHFNAKANLFATDLILLGSLNECDNNGVPQVFEEMPSNTYKLPTNIASTNMDNEGTMYGSKTMGCICKGSDVVIDGIEKANESFSSYQEWAANTDFSGKTALDDEVEYAVTEGAGIDWIYTGPSINKDSGNTLDDLYFPGGHFLGMSCFWPEVNIKSCVNLSRACEVGSMLSQRQIKIKKRNNKDEIQYSYLWPSGLIGRDELEDGNFRSIFATLNHNGLKVIKGEDSLYKYDLTPLSPNGYNGELYQKIKDKLGKAIKEEDNVFEEGSERADAYLRMLEKGNDDYYRFRMGVDDLTNSANTMNKYLGLHYDSDKTIVEMPIYNNSFYFYFGLINGCTAVDEFLKNYYSICSDVTETETNSAEDKKDLILLQKDIPYLEEDDPTYSGLSFEIMIQNIEGDINIKIYKGETKVSDFNTNTYVHTITGLTKDEYKVEVYQNSKRILSKTISVIYYIDTKQLEVSVSSATYYYYGTKKVGISCDVVLDNQSKTKKTNSFNLELNEGVFIEPYSYSIASGDKLYIRCTCGVEDEETQTLVNSQLVFGQNVKFIEGQYLDEQGYVHAYN